MIMESFILKILLILTAILNLSNAVYCPIYCKCFMLNKIRTVHCIGKHLISIDLNVPKSVQSLDVSYNIISELNDNVFQILGLERIIELNLSHNGINSIGLHAFKGLDSIKFIDLSYNHLYRIDPSTFEYNPSILHLMLSNNPLGYLPPQKPFLISNSIKSLEISNCRLSFLPSLAFKFLPHLEVLNISNNDILFIDENIIEDLGHLTLLDITKTGVKCEGRNSYLIEWVVKKSAKILGPSCNADSSIKNPDKPKMFEKMIMAYDENISEDVIDIAEDDYYGEDIPLNRTRECACSEFDEDRVKSTTASTIENVEINDRTISRSDYRSMLWFSFLNGFVIGGALFSSLILFWTTCYKYRCKRRRRRVGEIQEYDHVHSETPPPSYSDLFYNVN